MARINMAKNFAGKAYATQAFVTAATKGLTDNFNPMIQALQNAIKIDGTGTVDGIGSAINSILDVTTVADGQDTYKIKSTVLPDLAITNVKVIETETAESGVVGLINANIPANGVQQGDVFVITSSKADVADAVGGTYIMTSAVAFGESVEGKYVKLYTPEGHVRSVAGAMPDASGAVALKVNTNIGGDKSFAEGAVALTYSDFMTLQGDVLTIGDKTFSSKDVTDVYGADIAGIRTQLGDKPAQGTANVYARLTAIQSSLGMGEGSQDGIAKQLADEIAARKEDDTILKAGIQAQTAARKADDSVLETAIQSAVKIETYEATLSAVEGVVTVNMQNAGVVFAVLNSANQQVYPSISYADGKATLVADYEDGEVDSKWTIYYAANPVVQLAGTQPTIELKNQD